MKRQIVSGLAALLFACTLAAGLARADNEGQADLDKATQLKLSASTLSDLMEVIRLCEDAMKKGLDDANTQYAKSLLGSTLIQRGSTYASALTGGQVDPQKAADYRKVALGDLERGVELNPKQPQALFLIAKLNLMPEGDSKRGVEALNKAIDQAAEEPTLRAEALMLRSEIEKGPRKRLSDLDEVVKLMPKEVAALRARGEVHFELEQLDSALEDLTKAAAMDPKHAGTYEVMAMVQAKMKKYDEAIATLDKVRELVPQSPVAFVRKSQIYGQQKKFKEALEELDKAEALAPMTPTIPLLRAEVHQENGELPKALADVEKVLETWPGLPEAVRTHAMLLAGSKKTDEAITELEKLLQEHPKDELTQLQLGMLYSNQKKHDKALKLFSQVLAEHPDLWMALRAQGDTHLNQGQRAEAISDYEKALKLRPKDPGILNNLAWVLATAPEDKLRDGKRAVELANDACRVTQYKEDYILSTLAAAYAETGDFATAIKWSTKAVELATKQHSESLNKELESYKASKPWRESLLSAEEKKDEDEKTEEKKMEEKKIEEKKTGEKKTAEKKTEEAKTEEKK
jgi:tetratricopeptide (TPR) repeat protein